MATVQQIKDAAGAHIETVHGYTWLKQANIMAQRSGYNLLDLTTMNTFIDAVRAKSTELEAQANGVSDQVETVLALYSQITP